MINPAPTSRIDPALARGTLAEIGPAAAGVPAYVVLEFPNTSYRMHLKPTGTAPGPLGKRIIGTIRAQARRIDRVGSGGRYVEPVYGPPRRVQGAIIAISDDALVVNAGVPIHCTPIERGQKVEDFEIGQFVSFDVLPGATFSPSGG
ncbi:MAG: hypothetical protein H6811_05820 [Phycisphaeraceae bacterium]|nr:hypothetical protein [Phycisphaeraceae bacterium]